MDARRGLLHDARTQRRSQGRARPRPLPGRDRPAGGPGLGGQARSARSEGAAGHRELRLVAGRQGPDRLYQLPAGLASEHAGGLLDLRARVRPAAAARDGLRALEPDVRQALAGRPQGRLCRQKQYLCGGSGHGPDHAADLRRGRGHHQWDLGLGQRGGILHPGRVPLVPGQPVPRLLAVRHPRRAGLHDDQQHRHALSQGDDLQAPQAGAGQQRRPGRRRPGRGRLSGLDQDSRRSAQHLYRPPRMGRELRAKSSCSISTACRTRSPVFLGDAGDGRGPERLRRHGRGLGGDHGGLRLARRRPEPALAERARRLAACLSRVTRRPRHPAADARRLRRPQRRRRGRARRLALRHGLPGGRHEALPLPRPHGRQERSGAASARPARRASTATTSRPRPAGPFIRSAGSTRRP